MRYFYDTEFIEDGKTIDLISIGIVSEDRQEFYAQNLDCDFSKASEWVKQNVYPHLTRFDLNTLRPIIEVDQVGGYGHWFSKGSLASELRDLFIQSPTNLLHHGPEPEFWGYYADYDHVALCQLFGTMMDLPKGWPMYTRDIKQLCDSLGNPALPKEGKDEHHALADARWGKQAFEFLLSLTSPENKVR